jgi:hypothetical protein
MAVAWDAPIKVPCFILVIRCACVSPQKTSSVNVADKRTRSVSAAREAENKNLIAWFIVKGQKLVCPSDVSHDTSAEPTTNIAVQERSSADTPFIEHHIFLVGECSRRYALVLSMRLIKIGWALAWAHLIETPRDYLSESHNISVIGSEIGIVPGAIKQ